MIVRRVWPSRPTFESAFAEMDDRLRRELVRRLDPSYGNGSPEPAAGVFPPINVTQDDERFYVRAEVPGIKPDELRVTALRNRVAISGKREIPPEHDRVSYHRRERAEGSFSRTVALPTEVDAEGVDARYADGILTLTLPKAEEAKPRQIVVKT